MKRVGSHSYIQLLLIHWWMLYLSSPSLYTKLVNFVHLIKLLIFSWLNYPSPSPSLSHLYYPWIFFVCSLSYFVVQLGVQWGCWKSSFRSIWSRYVCCNFWPETVWSRCDTLWLKKWLFFFLQDMMFSLGTYVVWFLESILKRKFPHRSMLTWSFITFITK